jgi:hypothetical protein
MEAAEREDGLFFGDSLVHVVPFHVQVSER